MRTWISATILVAVAAMFQPTARAQSIWQKMKQAAKQSEQNAQAQQRQRQQAQQRGSTPATNARQAAADPPPPPVDLSSPVFKALFHKLDIGGVQMGMTPQEARAIIHHRYPSLTESQERPYVFNDLPNTEFTPELVFPAPGSNNGTMRVGLTLQPMQPEVLSISRSTEYEPGHAPTADNTVAALRAKYGPETKRDDTPLMDTISLLWVFDGAGNQVSSSDVERFLGSCPRTYVAPSAGYVSSPDTKKVWSANCRSSTLLLATIKTYAGNLTNSQGQSLPQGLVWKMGVDTICYPLFMKTTDEARAMVLAAKDANLQKTKKAADQVAPTL